MFIIYSNTWKIEAHTTTESQIRRAAEEAWEQSAYAEMPESLADCVEILSRDGCLCSLFRESEADEFLREARRYGLGREAEELISKNT